MTLGHHVAGILVALLRVYQRVISPLLGPRCRFYPSCSAYAIGCLRGLGVRRAVPYVVRRLLRCHPWHRGGVDLPPVGSPAHRRHAEGSRENRLMDWKFGCGDHAVAESHGQALTES